MRSRRVAIRLAPYIATFGLIGSTLAWQDAISHRLGQDVDTHPEVIVAEHSVPAVRVNVPAPSPAPSPSPTPSSTQTSEPIKPQAQQPVGPVTIAELKQQTVRPFSLVGVTWVAGMPATAKVEVQWHGRTGWSTWTELHQNLVPSEDAKGRPGTESQWVEWADGIAVRVTNAQAAKPVDMQVATINPGKDTNVTPMAVAQPSIILRGQWGARPQTSCEDPIYGKTTVGAVIHHTAGSNSYSKSESASIVRATQAYHMRSRGWCDIGYNFLVDRYGQIFEGRAGGINRPVRAAHSGNKAVNEMTMGVSLMGTFTSSAPTSPMKASTARLVAWRFANYHVPAKGTYTLDGKKLNRIAGHRDVISTECPGKYAYAWLGASGGLRDQVAQMLASGGASTPTVTGFRAQPLSSSSIRWSWSAVAGAARYDLLIAPTSTFSGSKLYRFSSTSVSLSGFKPATTYYGKVRAVKPDGTALTGFTSPVAAKTYASSGTPTSSAASAPSGLKLSRRTSSSLTFAWAPLAGAAKYQIRLSRWKSMASPTVQPSKNRDETFTGLSSRRVYYAQVRGLKSNGNALGGWSRVVAVATKR